MKMKDGKIVEVTVFLDTNALEELWDRVQPE
jgi:ketosteroid isomerase-like protein